MNEENKLKISRHIFKHSLKKSINDLLHKESKNAGLNFINYFTGHERLNTVGIKKINFYDFCHDIDKYCDKEWFIKLVESAREHNKNIHVINILRCIYNLYFGSINVFLPSYCNALFNKINPSCILDFTMGWGGRMIASCKSNVKKYIGIDSNNNLKEPYEHMIRILNLYYSTEIMTIFEDCLKIDYSKLEYDCVFTSPPYYNLELYTNTKKRTKKEWINNFYIPIITETFQYLQPGGYYCLNVNKKMYDDFLFNLLGECNEKYKLNNKTKNDEFIYVWMKAMDMEVIKLNIN